MAFCFNVPDGGYDEWSCDLVELAASQRLDDISLQAALLIHVRDDSAALQGAPKAKCISKHISLRRLLSEFFALSSGELTRLKQRDFGPTPESEISNPSSVRDAEAPTFDA